MHKLDIALSDVDRGVYQQLELRLAQHPSESLRHLVTRTLAYCLWWEEGIAFGKGISQAEEPAVWIHDLTGQLTAWIEVGTPAADRLHRATKASPRVAIYTQHDPRLLVKEVGTRTIHRLDEVKAFAFDQAFLDGLGATLGRATAWSVTHSDGTLYVEAGGASWSGVVTPVVLVAEA